MSDIIKSVKELYDYNFFIPGYQRGYRWESDHVKKLLNDVKRFKPNANDWYCLQPLVVKWHKVSETDDKASIKEGRWNVVDGQQRLTTISLILQYLQNKNTLHLSYETRSNWECAMNDEEKSKENIDFFHIYNAYQTIKEWFEEEQKIDPDIKDVVGPNLKNHCKFIWFDMDESCLIPDYAEEDLFLDLNKGKIKLTNAELIKALFLNRKNFGNDPDFRHRQDEISREWDEIEEMFNMDNGELWKFVNGENREKGSKIEIIFDMLAQKQGFEDEENTETYDFFQKRFEEASDQGRLTEYINKQWEEVKTVADKIRYWYGNKELYHKIGYILFDCKKASDKRCKMREIINKSKETAPEFKQYLKDEIVRILDWNGKDNLQKGNDDKKIRKALLLHNILTLNNQKNESARFSFKDYLSLKYDLEHINPTAEDAPQNEVEKRNWLKEESSFVDDKSLKKKMLTFDQFGDSEKESDAFLRLYKNVLDYYTHNQTDKVANDDMSNLVLLDYKTNRAYKNWSFARKRKFLFERDAEGRFIPFATKKAFNKQYTQEVIPNMTYWSENDKKAYEHDYKEVLKNYFK